MEHYIKLKELVQTHFLTLKPILYNALHMANNEGLRFCWIKEDLRNMSELTGASLATLGCSHRDGPTPFICKYPNAKQERVIVYDRALLTLLNESYSFCPAVAIYLASQGQ